MLETWQYTPISFKPSKCNHVPYIRNKCWMARWNNKILRMACCWLTVIESPSSILPSFFLLTFFHCIPHFQALPGWRDWQQDDEGQRRETEQGKTECVSKTHLVGISTCPGARRTDPLLESHHSPSHGVQVSHSSSGAQRRWHTNGWSSLARRNSSMHTVSSKGHKTVNQRIRDGNATNPLVWGNSHADVKKRCN